MKRLLALLGCCVVSLAARAQVFADNFESGIAPVFPRINGVYQLPPAPSTTQFQWLLGELAAGQTTTVEEVNAHFDPTYLAGRSAALTKADIDALRASFPNAQITDLVVHTPMFIRAVIDSPGSTYPSAYLAFNTHYAGAGLIIGLTINSAYTGVDQYAEDQNLSLTQAADKFATLAPMSSLLVARIDRLTGACGGASVLQNADTLRATGSIFKLWVLGGLARRIAEGSISSSDPVTLVAAKEANGQVVNTEPLGTVFPVIDMATMMIGVSDNSATNHIHQLVTRSVINQVITDFGVAQPTVLTPLLDTNENTHLLRTFPLATSQAYVNGTEDYQNQFLTDQIVPLGPVTSTPYFNTSLMVSGTWRATPFDICRAYAALRRLPGGSEAQALVNRTLGAAMAGTKLRNNWDRVWQKGGSLSSGSPPGGDGFHVITYAWMLEDADQDPWVVVGMLNSDVGGIDQLKMPSVLSRVLQLVRAVPP